MLVTRLPPTCDPVRQHGGSVATCGCKGARARGVACLAFPAIPSLGVSLTSFPCSLVYTCALAVPVSCRRMTKAWCSWSGVCFSTWQPRGAVCALGGILLPPLLLSYSPGHQAHLICRCRSLCVCSYYASAGDPTHATTLTSQQFRKFARDAKLLAPAPGEREGDRPPPAAGGKRISGAALDLVFTRHTGLSAAATSAKKGSVGCATRPLRPTASTPPPLPPPPPSPAPR